MFSRAEMTTHRCVRRVEVGSQAGGQWSVMVVDKTGDYARIPAGG